jgi:hypothetical protein
VASILTFTPLMAGRGLGISNTYDGAGGGHGSSSPTSAAALAAAAAAGAAAALVALLSCASPTQLCARVLTPATWFSPPPPASSSAAVQRWSARVSRGCAKQHNAKIGRTIVVCENVDDYRRVIPKIVQETDVVLEVGCHEGITTALLGVVASRAVGVDKSVHCIPIARDRFPHIEFHVVDVIGGSGVQSIRKTVGVDSFDLIFVDVSGSRDLGTLIPLIEKLDAAFAPRAVVVKGYKLRRLLNRLMLPEEVGVAIDSQAYQRRAEKLRFHRIETTSNVMVEEGLCSKTAMLASDPKCSTCDAPLARANFSGKQIRRLRRGAPAHCRACVALARQRDKKPPAKCTALK